MTVMDKELLLGKEVPIEKVERELRLLWEADDARTNASLINLAIYSEDETALVDNSNIIRELTREHACRALLIGLDRDNTDVGVKSWINAHCHLAHGQKSVCCEQIAFHLTGHSRGRFRNTIFAHVQSDLPLIFWWQGNLSNIFSESLYRRIDRLVVDSSNWEKPLEQFDKIGEAIDKVNLVVQDLSWTRTYHFRLAIAALYDDLTLTDSLDKINQIKLVVNPENRLSGLQLIAWFTTMAGWQRAQDLISDKEHLDSYRFSNMKGNLVDVEILEEESSAPIGKIEILAGNIKVMVSRETNSKYLHQRLENGSHVVDVHGPADSDSKADLVTDQLSRGGKNSLFKRVLPMFMELLKN